MTRLGQACRSPKAIAAILILWTSLSSACPDDAFAASRKKKLVVFTTTHPAYGAVTCALVKGSFQAGTLQRKDRFKLASAAISPLAKKVRTAKRRKSKKLPQLQAQLAALEAKVNATNALCVLGPNPPPTPNPPETPNPPPTPPTLPPASGDSVSLEPMPRQLVREDVRYLLEKAGFGMAPQDEALVQVALTQGVEGLVNEFMLPRAETSALLTRVDDRLDGRLGSQTTQSASGQRTALMDLWVHTQNPYSERMAITLLGIWTVAGDVIADETFRSSFWDYYTRLRRYALDSTNIEALGLEITRDPLMLIYLSNNTNRRGSPNENYARELMELFTVGPVNAQGVPNYTETQPDGSGDIAVAARMLTGWTVKLNYVTNKLDPIYKPQLHEVGPHTMFPGTAYQFSGENDADLVRGIIAHHPGVRQFYARELLKEYLTPNPPAELVEAFGNVIHSYGYRLRPAMAVLLKSKAFFHDSYKNTLPKTSVEFAVETVRTLGLADAFDPAEGQRQLIAMGMPINEAPSVFWFNPRSWTGPGILLERANYLARILSDSTAHRLPEPDWSAATILPQGAVGTRDLIQHVAIKLGLGTLTEDQILTLESYLDRNKTWDGRYEAAPFNNLNPDTQKRKGLGAYYVMSALPAFQLK